MSTAAELIEAAGACIQEHKYQMADDGMESRNMRAARLVAEHILATVREDDDDLANWVWVNDVLSPSIGLAWNFHAEPHYTFFDWQTSSGKWNQMTVEPRISRGRMRKLFEGLGIELGETR